MSADTSSEDADVGPSGGGNDDEVSVTSHGDFSILTPPSASRRKSQRSTPRRMAAEEGYELGRSGASNGLEQKLGFGSEGGGCSGGAGGSKETPLELGSSQESFDHGDGTLIGSSGEEDHDQDSQTIPAVKKEEEAEETSPSSAGGSRTPRLFSTPGEKALLYLAVTKRRPSASKGHIETEKAWHQVVKDVLKRTTLTLETSAGPITVTIDLSGKCESMGPEARVNKVKNKFSEDRRKFMEKQKKIRGLTGEGTVAPEEWCMPDDGTVDHYLAQAAKAWEEGKASKVMEPAVTKEMKTHAANLRDQARDGMKGSGKGKKKSKRTRAGGGSADFVTQKKSSAGRKSGPAFATHSLLNKRRHGSKGSGSKKRAPDLACDSAVGGDGYALSDSEESEEDAAEVADEENTMIASGRAGRQTREARGGGKRKRVVKPLSEGSSRNPVMSKLLDAIGRVNPNQSSAAVAEGAVTTDAFRSFSLQMQQQQLQFQQQQQQQFSAFSSQLLGQVAGLASSVRPHAGVGQTPGTAMPMVGFAGAGMGSVASQVATPLAGVPGGAVGSVGGGPPGCAAVGVVSAPSGQQHAPPVHTGGVYTGLGAGVGQGLAPNALGMGLGAAGQGLGAAGQGVGAAGQGLGAAGQGLPGFAGATGEARAAAAGPPHGGTDRGGAGGAKRPGAGPGASAATVSSVNKTARTASKAASRAAKGAGRPRWK